jgi:hypothetical protein
MEPRQPGKLEVILALVSTTAMMWYMMPPQERYWVKLRVLQNLRRLSARYALREGHQGMTEELQGKDPEHRYGMAFLMSRVRDMLDKALEEMRP